MKNKKSLIVFVIALIVVSVLKQLLVYNLPIVANVALGVDDMLMIDITNNLVNGNWVGPYSDIIISKGLTFPLLLAFCYFIKIDYITMMTLLYTMACLIFIYVLSKKIKNKLLLFIIYTITLFVPIMYSYQVMQRVYRNAIIPSFSIMIIAGYLYLFFTRNEESYKKKILASLGTGIILALFWYTREDSIWMLPFIIFIIISQLVAVIVKNKKINKEILRNLLILAIPIFMVFAYKNILCYQNYKHFGVYTVYNNEQYNKAIKSLKKVKKYDYYDNIDFTMEKMKRVSEVTCLGNIYGKLVELVYGYSLFDSGPLDGEVVNGWFPWAFKATLSECGYYGSPQDLNNFCYTLHVQIEENLANGTLEREDVKTDIISAIKKVWYETLRVFKAIYAYDDIGFEGEKLEYEAKYENLYQMYAKYTNNKFLLYDTETNEDKYYFDNMENYVESIKPRTEIINKLINIYKIVSNVVFCSGVILYLIFSVIVIKQVFKKKFENLEMWVTISGILGAMLTLVLGIAYETAFNAYVITAMYLSAVYPLMLLFGTIMIGYSIIKIAENIRIIKSKKLVSGTV
ncbi:MAG: hypothetical protein IJW20_00445 [Clostridia bacterium]|nr:hypothetical protein [Clostridia bacterium]